MRERDYLICIDSDGCAMNTMNGKHFRSFGPEWVKQFRLDEVEKEALEYWNHINLFSKTRGINRFLGLAMGLQWAEEKGYAIEGLRGFVKWTKEAEELSNPALLAECQRRKNSCMEQALLWSIHVNLSVKEVREEDGPFEGVKETLEDLSHTADLAVVSSANGQAVEEEWARYGLKDYCKALLSQEAGSKAECIKRLLQEGYEKKKTIMAGDAMGDYRAARENGVWFFPIVVNREKESWRRLREEAYPRLKAGTFGEVYQAELLEAFERGLETEKIER